MIVELQRFVEFTPGWWHDKVETRENMVFEPMTINTEYVTWIKRYELTPNIQLCDVHFADRGSQFRFDISYEEMRGLLRNRT